MPSIANLVMQTSTTTGTGNFTLSSVTGSRTFASALPSNSISDLFEYFIKHDSADEWEVGEGYLSSGALVRQTVIESSNSNTLVSFSAGNKTVTCDRRASLLQTFGKETIWIGAAGMTPATTAGAAPGTFESTTNKVNIDTLDFDATADEHAHFNIALPKSWNEGTVTFQAFWFSTATDTDGVAWGLQAVAFSDNETLDTAYGTAVVVTDAAQSAAGELYVTAESSAVTISGSPAANDLIAFRLFRDVSDGADTMAEDARLVGIKLFITTDAPEDS